MGARKAGVCVVVAAVLALAMGCGGSEDKAGPKTSEFGEERAALVKRIAQKKAKQEAAKPRAAGKPAAQEQGVALVGFNEPAWADALSGK